MPYVEMLMKKYPG